MPRGSRGAAGLVILLAAACAKAPAPPAAGPDYPIRPIPFTQVKVDDVFWAPRMETNRAVTVPFALNKNEETGRVDNFRKAAGLMKGAYQGKRYNDSDIFKAMEAASYTLMLKPDPALDKRLDDLIAIIAKAQEPDGYLFTNRTIDPKNPAPGSGAERWSNLRVSHELYNVGHMYEAAVAHFQATGQADLPGHRAQERRPSRPDFRPGQTARLSRPPGDRDRAGQAVPGHGTARPPRPGQVLPGRTGPLLPGRALRAGGPVLHLQLRRVPAEPQARPGAGRGRRPRRAGHVHVCRDGRRGRPGRAPRLCQGHRPAVGERRRQEDVRHGRRGSAGRRRGLWRRLRAAQRNGLYRDLRRHRPRPVGAEALSPARTLGLCRRAGADHVQRPAVGRLARRHVLLLPEPPGGGRQDRALPGPGRPRALVRSGLLPAQTWPVSCRPCRATSTPSRTMSSTSTCS